MGVLSDSDILSVMKNGTLLIEPFSSECLSPAGYDLRSGDRVEIPVRGMALIHTLERLSMPPGVCGHLFIRSSFAREGLFGSFAFVDPGFRGQLTLSFVNLGAAPVAIGSGERLAQIVFQSLEHPASKPYSGQYQNSTGAVRSRRHFQSDM